MHSKLLTIFSAGVLIMAGSPAWAQSGTAEKTPGHIMQRTPQEHPNTRLVTSSGSTSRNQHLSSRPIIGLPRLQLASAPVKSTEIRQPSERAKTSVLNL
jgi:hypothetical protein